MARDCEFLDPSKSSALLGKVEARNRHRGVRIETSEDYVMIVLKVVVFGVASLALGYLSRECLRHPRTHGFPRFFAWEAIVALFLLDVDWWFDDPHSFRQLASWTLLTLSGFLVLAGLYQLKSAGRPNEERSEPGLLGWEKTTELITDGIFAYIRHPMYTSLLLLAWGIFLKAPSWPGVALAGAASLGLWLTAALEEVEDVRYFGVAYQNYVRRSWMFVPPLV
jgi:protein-S-isoprenylcysteine O-methyltransferase Ste14